MTWRVGTKNPHALYEDNEPVGMVIEPLNGRRIVAGMNEAARLRLAHEGAEQAWRRAEKENDELRAALEQIRVSCDKAMDEQHAKLVRVADEKRAANALLREVTGCVSDTLLERIETHLAGQPAATRTEAETKLVEGDAQSVSSLRIEVRGAHAHVSVFFRGKLSGVLVVSAGEEERALVRLLVPEPLVREWD